MDAIKTIVCEHCDQKYSIDLNIKDYEIWKRGESPIQNVLGYLPSHERELLISSTCNNCFRSMFDEYA